MGIQHGCQNGEINVLSLDYSIFPPKKGCVKIFKNIKIFFMTFLLLTTQPLFLFTHNKSV